MPQRTDIEWADYSSNPLRARDPKTNKVGWACARVSAGCQHCYSATLNSRFGTGRDYTAQNVKAVTTFLDDAEIGRLLRFRPRGPFKGGTERAKVFPFDMTDLFGDWVPTNTIVKVLAAFALRPDVDFLILTKRAAMMADVLAADGLGNMIYRQVTRWLDREDGDPLGTGSAWDAAHKLAEWRGDGGTIDTCKWALPLANVWTGFSAEDQPNFDARWEHARALAQAGWLTWCSAEPLLGPVVLPDTAMWAGSGLKLVIVGGESGHGARPMHPDWARGLRDQCEAAGVPFFFKQWGQFRPFGTSEEDTPQAAMDACDSDRWRWVDTAGVSDWTVGTEDRAPMIRVGKKAAGRMLDGRTWNEFPAPSAAVR